ncbi:hypothetical protein Patl1_16588 [Pistacia atlantica]|uniref:Uncharacterized protein n=1 Tax=Pistacia atlantica TaxID=434234 RepID=A0ACC1B9K4_9ROSI|nr:hypothetical protein Patl1_16588 [Pistacia atlantica]
MEDVLTEIPPPSRFFQEDLYNFAPPSPPLPSPFILCPVAAGRSHIVAKLLIGEQIVPERVLILDSVQTRNFRGKLSLDETCAFKLETSSERKGGSSLLKDVDYFPSGSMVDGFGRCFVG